MSRSHRNSTQEIPLEGLRADYDIAKRNSRFRRKRTGVSTVGTTGDYHYRNETDFLYAIELGRDFDRNDPIAGMALDRLQSNVLQGGIGIEPDTGYGQLDDALKKEWSKWANDEDNCDVAGEHTFRELERIVFRSTLVDGDNLALPNRSGALEIMEAHRCRTPTNTNRNVVHGVLLSEERKRLEYWFTKDELDPSQTFAKVSEAVPVKARDVNGNRQVFHVYNPGRVSQTRGVSVFRRCADFVGMHDDIQFANLVKQQVASCFTFIRKRSANGSKFPGDLATGNRTLEQGSSGTKVIDGFAPGMQVVSDPGEEIQPFSPNIHSAEFFTHAMLILKIIAANLNLPVHAILLDASETNYSGWRGAIDQAKVGFREIQDWYIRRFHARVYAWKIRSFLESSKALQLMAKHPKVRSLYGVEFQKPVWDYIDPLKDAAADSAKLDAMLDSRRSLLAARGLNIEVVVRDTILDNARAIKQAKRVSRLLNEDIQHDSERIVWRELLTLPGSKTLGVNLASKIIQDEIGPPQQPQNETPDHQQGAEN